MRKIDTVRSRRVISKTPAVRLQEVSKIPVESNFQRLQSLSI
jgi:hypothetical protein